MSRAGRNRFKLLSFPGIKSCCYFEAATRCWLNNSTTVLIVSRGKCRANSSDSKSQFGIAKLEKATARLTRNCRRPGWMRVGAHNICITFGREYQWRFYHTYGSSWESRRATQSEVHCLGDRVNDGLRFNQLRTLAGTQPVAACSNKSLSL